MRILPNRRKGEERITSGFSRTRCFETAVRRYGRDLPRIRPILKQTHTQDAVTHRREIESHPFAFSGRCKAGRTQRNELPIGSSPLPRQGNGSIDPVVEVCYGRFATSMDGQHNFIGFKLCHLPKDERGIVLYAIVGPEKPCQTI